MTGYDVGSQIKGLVGSLQRNNPDLSAGACVKRAWNNSVDKRTRDHVTGVFVVPNTNASEVIVYVDSSIWATELTMQTEILRLNMNIRLNEDENLDEGMERRAEQVQKLTFKVSKDKFIPKERRMTTLELLQEEEASFRDVQPMSLSDEEISDLQEAFSHISNEKIKDSAYAAAKANLEWRKGMENNKVEKVDFKKNNGVA